MKLDRRSFLVGLCSLPLFGFAKLGGEEKAKGAPLLTLGDDPRYCSRPLGEGGKYAVTPAQAKPLTKESMEKELACLRAQSGITPDYILPCSTPEEEDAVNLLFYGSMLSAFPPIHDQENGRKMGERIVRQSKAILKKSYAERSA